jgi:hypothetical protein
MVNIQNCDSYSELFTKTKTGDYATVYLGLNRCAKTSYTWLIQKP